MPEHLFQAELACACEQRVQQRGTDPAPPGGGSDEHLGEHRRGPVLHEVRDPDIVPQPRPAGHDRGRMAVVADRLAGGARRLARDQLGQARLLELVDREEVCLGCSPRVDLADGHR